MPLFVFLSGCSTRYSHRLDRVFVNLLKMWIKWIVFISITDIVYFVIVGNVTITEPIQWLNQIFFSTDTSYLSQIPVLPASMWFMSMYIVLSILGSCVICIMEKLEINDSNLFLILFFLIIGLSYMSLTNSGSWFLIPRKICFYGIMYIGGYLSYKLINKKTLIYVLAFALDIFLWFVTSKLYGISFAELIYIKQNPHIMFLFASMVCVIIYLVLYGKFDTVVNKSKFLTFIGKNSLSYYFSQGIACSIPYTLFINNQQLQNQYPWFLLLTLALMFNIVVGIILGTVFSYLMIFAERKMRKGINEYCLGQCKKN